MNIKLTLAIVFILPWAPLQADPTNPAAVAETITIGVITPLSGEFAPFGAKVRQGIERAAQPGVRFVYEDEGCEPAKAVTAFRKLTAVDGVKLLIGPACGSPQEAVAPLLKGGALLAVLNSSASEDLFQTSGGQMFSAQYSIEEEARFVAEQSYARGARRVLITMLENSFSRAHEKAFRAAFKGQVLETRAYSADASTQLRAAVLRAKQLKADALFVPDTAPFFRGLASIAKQLGVALPIYSIYGFQMPELLAVEKQNAESVRYSYPDIGDESAVEYFPYLAAKMLIAAAIPCAGEPVCTKQELQRQQRFDSQGQLQAEKKFVLKTVRNGKYTQLE